MPNYMLFTISNIALSSSYIVFCAIFDKKVVIFDNGL